MIEEKYKPIDEDCLLLKKYLKENAKIRSQNEKNVGTEEKITKPEEISQVIDPNINQNGNYALLELTNEKAEKLKLGTRKVITPLKKFTNEEILNGSERRKEGYFLIIINYKYLHFCNYFRYFEGEQRKKRKRLWVYSI